MRFWVTLIMLAALVFGPGTSVAASICRHDGMTAHIAARESGNLAKAASALAEESAGAVAAKKSAPASGASVSAPADMLAPPPLPLPAIEAATLAPHATEIPALAGLNPRPPLPPPLG
ncbi:MAG: hypothetical protein E6G94_03490 [Alphaproteobacteria bacterium]|nr:MAG: hypothetical protein E6G94_03490 [Alphaproteobacteria bacterium]